MDKIYTLCTVLSGGRILLGLKKQRLGKGLFNGFGGRVKKGETVRAAAIRELREECGATALKIRKMGVLRFKTEGSERILVVHIFRVDEFSGDIRESAEMKPQWFSQKKIPYKKMWTDDKYWLPLLLAGKKFKGTVVFKKLNQIKEHSIHEN